MLPHSGQRGGHGAASNTSGYQRVATGVAHTGYMGGKAGTAHRGGKAPAPPGGGPVHTQWSWFAPLSLACAIIYAMYTLVVLVLWAVHPPHAPVTGYLAGALAVLTLRMTLQFVRRGYVGQSRRNDGFRLGVTLESVLMVLAIHAMGGALATHTAVAIVASVTAVSLAVAVPETAQMELMAAGSIAHRPAFYGLLPPVVVAALYAQFLLGPLLAALSASAFILLYAIWTPWYFHGGSDEGKDKDNGAYHFLHLETVLMGLTQAAFLATATVLIIVSQV